MFARRHNAVKYCSEECTEAASTQREQTRPPRSRKGPVHASCQCCNVVYAKKTASDAPVFRIKGEIGKTR